MPTEQPSSATFERLTDISADSPTLIEGLPGLGMVASIAVDQITQQLDLGYSGHIQIDDFPPVAAFRDGRVRESIRVNAGEQPDVMTLQSDVPIPQQSVRPLANCVLDDLAEEFERAIFLAGAPATSEEDIGNIVAIATDEAIEDDLRTAGIPLAEGHGLVGGITGALTNTCYQADVSAAVLVVQADPFLPDPTAARAVIEDALEPLVDFDIDTAELEEQADRIKQHMEQVARHYQQVAEGQQPASEERHTPMMYQ